MFNEEKPDVAYYEVVWFVGNCKRSVHTDSCISAEEVLELLKIRSARKGDIGSCFIVAHPACDFF